MTRMALAYLVALAVFAGADFVWLAYIARDFYRSQLGSLLADKPQLLPAMAFYLLFVLGLIIFGVAPAIKEHSWRVALAQGAMFGFFAYATYDLTNLATLKDWPMALSFADLAWGTLAAGTASLCSYLAASSITDKF